VFSAVAAAAAAAAATGALFPSIKTKSAVPVVDEAADNTLSDSEDVATKPNPPRRTRAFSASRKKADQHFKVQPKIDPSVAPAASIHDSMVADADAPAHDGHSSSPRQEGWPILSAGPERQVKRQRVVLGKDV
jgi:hypothetical protein